MKLLTDYFQSLELVKAGVPKETADYFFHKDCIYTESEKRQEPAFPYVPCWSIGALWEYFHDTGRVYDFGTDMSSSELLDAMVSAIVNDR